MNTLLRSYIGTALWSSIDDNDEPLDSKYDITDLDQDFLDQSQKDIDLFLEKADHLLSQIDHDLDQVMHDFWLTREGHGAGFWDGDYPEKIGEELTNIAQSFPRIEYLFGHIKEVES